MGIIRILPAEIANKIAAGEVVERPASVIKELVENSIDAKSTRISIHTTEGGRRMIHICDDGCGMDKNDALLCIEAHATSKIKTSKDIERIRTLGFRGEALPSISSVTQFLLQTRKHDQETGIELFVNYGKLQEVHECGCPCGTSIKVNNLFGNTPARRKFLRTPATEDRYIQECVLLQALSHPEISFELKMNNRQIFITNGKSNLKSRIGMLLGKDIMEGLISVDYEEAGIEITGYIARPGLTRKTRTEQRIFVNGRPAAANNIYYSIRDAYHTMVIKGRYPPVVLYININPERVDVNVHPSKKEVRFREPRLVGQVLEAAIRRSLQDMASLSSQSDINCYNSNINNNRYSSSELVTKLPVELVNTPQQQNLEINVPIPESKNYKKLIKEVNSSKSTCNKQVENIKEQSNLTEEFNYIEDYSEEINKSINSEVSNLRVIGVLKKIYIITEGEFGLVLINKTAAHERIIYEQLLKNSRKEKYIRQPLLLPITINLPASDTTLLIKYKKYFNKIGFSIEPFGGNTFIINAVPANFPQENIQGLLHDILDDLRGNNNKKTYSNEIIIAQVACKYAIKTADVLAEEEIQQLLLDLSLTEMPYTSPSGKPVMINYPFNELTKRFDGKA